MYIRATRLRNRANPYNTDLVVILMQAHNSELNSLARRKPSIQARHGVVTWHAKCYIAVTSAVTGVTDSGSQPFLPVNLQILVRIAKAPDFLIFAAGKLI